MSSNSIINHKKLLELFIKNVVSSILVEEEEDMSSYIASTPPSRPKAIAAPKQQFDMETFKSQPDAISKIRYLQNTLKQVGEGSTRLVFQINPKEVIKMAKPNSNGIQQNSQEANACALKTTSSNVFTKVFEVGPNFEWIRAEFASPIQSQDFFSYTKIPWQQFQSAMIGVFPEKQKQEFQVTNQHKSDANQLMKNEFFKNLISTIKQCHYEPGDIVKLSSWGKIDNRVVLVDYGLSE